MKPIDKVLSTAQGALTKAASANGEQPKQAKPTAAKAAIVDAINQVFAELELAYHNQFHKAFAQEGSLQLAKKYWLTNLADFSPEVLKRAVRHLVQTQEFLPSIASMIAACENGQALFGLPTAEAAYREACLAPEPKAAFAWSHPAVYFAAQATGWFELANEVQSQVLPQFRYYYEQLCRRVMHGENLEVTLLPALPEKVFVPLSPEANRSKLKMLRQQLEL
jgi:hypothetical protein